MAYCLVLLPFFASPPMHTHTHTHTHAHTRPHTHPHAAHVIEEARDVQSGVEFLTTTRDDWKESISGCHITWHLTLYYLGKLLACVKNNHKFGLNA